MWVMYSQPCSSQLPSERTGGGAAAQGQGFAPMGRMGRGVFADLCSSRCSNYTCLAWPHPSPALTPTRSYLAFIPNQPGLLLFLHVMRGLWFPSRASKTRRRDPAKEPCASCAPSTGCTGSLSYFWVLADVIKLLNLFSKACEIGPCCDSAGLSVHK